MFRKIDEITAREAHIELLALVVRWDEDINAKAKRHAWATLEDETGQVVLNLWRELVDSVKVWDVAHISDGFAQFRDGRLELSTWENIRVS